MKTINKILVACGLVASLGVVSTSCVGDLNLMPTDPNDTTSSKFIEAPDQYMDAMIADCFFNFLTFGIKGNNILDGVADGGFSTFQRGIFNCQEMPTDEACWLWYTNDAETGLMPFGKASTTTGMAYAPYYRFIVNSSICNDFITTWSADQEYVKKANQDNRKKYIVYARVLREICMYYMLDLYGNVPWIDDDTAVGSTPKQLTAGEIFANLCAEMENTLKDFDATCPKTPAYGYLSIDVVDAYLMKLYMNGNQYGGTTDWKKAYDHAMNIINRHQGSGFQGSGLAHDYNQVFGAYNRRFAPGGDGVNEILWTLPSENTKIETYAGATLMLSGYGNTHGSGDMATIYNTTDAWNCILARKQLVQKFEWNEPEMATSDDQRTRFWMTAAQGYSYVEGTPLNADNCPNNGYPTIKFTNWYINDDGTINTAASGATIKEPWNTDYPMVRLAEVYLSAAEAILNGGGGSQSEALKYVNYIRERAGVEPWIDVTIQTLREERQRELYGECTRRTDLKRYGLWISGYNWDWKGSDNNYDGQDFDSKMVWYPLPPNVVSMAGYQQNPGY